MPICLPCAAIKVRLASPPDIAAMATMLEMLRAVSFWATVPFSPDYSHAYTRLAFRLQDEYSRVLVLDNAGELFGMCGGEVLSHEFVPNAKHLWEWALWIDPTLRGQGWGLKFWEPMCAWAKTKGAVGALRGRPRIRNGKYTEELIWTYWG